MESNLTVHTFSLFTTIFNTLIRSNSFIPRLEETYGKDWRKNNTRVIYSTDEILSSSERRISSGEVFPIFCLLCDAENL